MNASTSANQEDSGHSLDDEASLQILATLPRPDTKRWVISRKVKVVNAVQRGLIQLDQACHRYNLTEEEFLSWAKAVQRLTVRPAQHRR